MTNRLPRYVGQGIGHRLQCNGVDVSWTPVWRQDEPEPCDECGCSCQSEATAPVDTAVPAFHLGPIDKRPKDMERCTACGGEWQDLAGIIKAAYPADAFVSYLNKDSGFFKALRSNA